MNVLNLLTAGVDGKKNAEGSRAERRFSHHSAEGAPCTAEEEERREGRTSE